MKNETRKLRFEIIKLSEAQFRVEKAIETYINSLDYEAAPLNREKKILLNRLYDLQATVIAQSEEFSDRSNRTLEAERLREKHEQEEADKLLQEIADRRGKNH